MSYVLQIDSELQAGTYVLVTKENQRVVKEVISQLPGGKEYTLSEVVHAVSDYLLTKYGDRSDADFCKALERLGMSSSLKIEQTILAYLNTHQDYLCGN